MTKRECAIISIYTDVAMLSGDDIDELYGYASELMKRPVFTHEFSTLNETLKELAKPDFIKLCETATETTDTEQELWGFRCDGQRMTGIEYKGNRVLNIDVHSPFEITSVVGREDGSSFHVEISKKQLRNDLIFDPEWWKE